MSRWGDTIYDSDGTQDSLGPITHRLECELAYWLAPDWVTQGWPKGDGLAQILAVIELMLLFEQHLNSSGMLFSSSVILWADEQAVRRWRDVVLNIWDGDWHEDPPISSNAISQPAYRQQHRVAISTMFDRLESLAHEKEHPGESDLVPLSKEHPLPYFSIYRGVDQDGSVRVGVERFIWDFKDSFIKDIIYWLSAERRSEVLLGEDVWVAVDLLGFLCETYDISPYIDEQHIRTWRDKTLEIGKDWGMDSQSGDEALIRNIIDAFDRLEKIAQKHPKKFL